MIGVPATKVRLVLCPKCRKLLPEIAEFPLYQCGGCGAFLRAKNHGNNNSTTPSDSHETGSVQRNELEHVSEEKAILSSTEACPLDKKNGGNDLGNCSTEQPEDANCSNGVSSSMEQPVDENFSNKVSSSMEQPEQVTFSNGVPSSVEHLEEVNFSNGVSSSMEESEDENFPSLEQPEEVSFSHGGSSPMEQREDENYSDKVSSIMKQPEDDKFEKVGSSTEQPEDVNFSNEVSLLTEEPKDGNFSNEVSSSTEQLEDVNFPNEVSSPMEQPEDARFLNEVSSLKEQHGDANFSNEVSSSKQQPEDLNSSNEVSSSKLRPEDVSFLNGVSLSSEPKCQHNEEPRSIAEANTVVEDDGSDCYFRSVSSDNQLGSRERSLDVTTQRPTGEGISKDTHISHSIEQMEQSGDVVLHGFDCVRSTDTLEGTEGVNPSSELCDALKYRRRSPTATSFYAYDGSVSSYDGTDDQVLDRPLHQPKRNLKVREFVGRGERSRGKFLVNSNSEIQDQGRNFSSISLGKEHNARKCSKWDRDEFLESMRNGQPVRNWMRSEREEFPSRSPFYQRDFPAVYENGNASSHGHPDFQWSSSFHSPDKPEFREQERIKLLKMVYELQDQLYRKHNGKPNGRVPTSVNWNGKHIAKCYGHEASEEEICNNLNYPRYPERYRHSRNWTQQRKFSRMAFSGEATNIRHQVDYSCLHCCPQDRWYSAQLPPLAPCRGKGLCEEHPGHICYNHCASTPSSPLSYIDSEFPLWSHDAKSDDQGHKKREVKLYWEKHHQVKRHIQPIAGAAPFLACYHCSSLLQLPADFLLFKRRCHELRCGACSELLKFSVQNRTHIVRYIPTSVDPPPPSEVDEMSSTFNGGNLASTALFNDCSPAEPMSCSDDYGLSFCKSYSTEGEPAFLIPPFDIPRGNRDDKMPMNERKKKPTFKQSQNNYKKPVEPYKSVGSSSNMPKTEKLSSEIEELPPTTGSPLHRLMGYSSPSAMIHGFGMDADSYYEA